MAKASQKIPAWVLTLRQVVKQEHGRGWTLREANGHVQLTQRFPDGRRQSVTLLDLPWGPESTTQALTRLTTIRERMGRGMGLKEAAGVGQGPTAALGQVDWLAVAESWRKFKLESGQVNETTWQRHYQPVVNRCLAMLQGRSAPSTAKQLLERLRDKQGAPAGSAGRRELMRATAAFMRYAVDREGAPAQWLPPASVGELIGRRIERKRDSSPIRDEEVARLLQMTTDPQWSLALGLMACFGLRPVELGHCRPTHDGERLYVEWKKRTSAGEGHSREVSGLDPIGCPGLSAELLQRLKAGGRVPGMPSLPRLGRDVDAAGKVRHYLHKQPVWLEILEGAEKDGRRVTCYSFRHGYSFRAHEMYGLSPRVTAQLMGHTLAVHLSSYGQWADKRAVVDAVTAARERVKSLAAV